MDPDSDLLTIVVVYHAMESEIAIWLIERFLMGNILDYICAV